MFIPRDRFSTGLISKMRNILLDAFNGTECSFTTHFSTSVLAQIHYVVRLNGSSLKNVDFCVIESQLKLAGQSWEDLLSEHIMSAFDEEKVILCVRNIGMRFKQVIRLDSSQSTLLMISNTLKSYPVLQNSDECYR